MVDVTYSLESAFVKAYSAVAVGVQGLLDAAGTLERITRPPRKPLVDMDEPLDGAEQLAVAEEEREVWEPLYCPFCGSRDCRDPECRQEPQLADDELVAVRGLIQERYPNFPGAHTDSSLVHGVPCDDPAGVDTTSPPAVPPAGPDLDWRGWATPAILTVLAAHFPFYDDDAGMYECVDDMGCVGASFGDTHAWRQHIAPKIADRIACDPARAIAALQNFEPK